ncbi:MAG: sigma-70 family RNA polymerase sigma factor [Planctomycetes bacterium]|nr:sigma-70 family RNA polymerase sigma factor [Planctomycetota bacterium]
MTQADHHDQGDADRSTTRDQQTRELLAAGDAEGLRRLLSDHGGTVRLGLRRALGRALDEHDLDEALNAAVTNIWQSRLVFDPSQGTLRSWLFIIARNCALNMLATRRPDTVSLDRLGTLPPDLRNPGAEADRLRLALDVQRCLSEMPEQLRAVLGADLAAGGTASTTDLAARLDTSTGAIHVARSRGRVLLRKKLSRLGYEIEPAPRAERGPTTDPEPRLG